MNSVFRGGRFLIAVESLIAAVGIVDAAISAYVTLIVGFVQGSKRRS